MALLLIAVILVLGFVLPESQHLASLLVVPPTIAAAVAGVRVTASIALLSCGIALLLDVMDGLWYSAIPGIHVIAIVCVTGFVIALRAIRDRSMRELIEVRAISDAVQRVLLRPLPRRIGSLSIASVYHSSQPSANIGGDLYAAVRTPTGLRFVIGDVRGKGLPAVDDAVTLLGGFREAAPRAADLPELAAYLEQSMETHFREAGETDSAAVERFVTALFLEVSNEIETVKTVNCGHYPPLLIGRKPEGPTPPRRPSPPLGLNSRSRGDYQEERFEFGPGETFLLYTDGVIEARDSAGNFYDLDAVVGQWSDSNPDLLLGRILDDLSRHTDGHLDDDVAMVAVRRDDPMPTGASRG
ncbi:PP2C family protein-serine/threonine phosphatase [Streptomyces polygonati]|uniref:PP2C family protein-serine/threonine phosphatase n=1 Tax=Streptomyces polygonati TaxID=1617087 RepID=A0ABV8HN84_9ACTN